MAALSRGLPALTRLPAMAARHVVIVPSRAALEYNNRPRPPVAYNAKVVMTPISKIQTGTREHYQTRELFVETAQTNSIEEWQQHGIPPVEAMLYKGTYYHLIGEGQTRINSAHKAQKDTEKDIQVPLWDITEHVRLMGESTFGRPIFCVVLDTKMHDTWKKPD